MTGHPDTSAAPAFLTTVEAAARARRHPVTIRKALESGELHGSQRGAGGRWAIRPECVDAFVEGRPCHHQASRSTVRQLRGRRAVS